MHAIKSIQFVWLVLLGLCGSSTLSVNISIAGEFEPMKEILSAGAGHNCVVRADMTVACWGDNRINQATPSQGRFTQVSAGLDHSCGVRTDGTVTCWGDDSAGQSSPPDGAFTQVAVGGFFADGHSCGIRSNGTVACWGAGMQNTGITPNFGQASPPAGTFVYISAGGLHTCGIRDDLSVTCWGAGIQNTGNNPHFGQAEPLTGTFAHISAGAFHTCGVRTNGSVGCWGLDDVDQATPEDGIFTQVSAGGVHTCGVRENGTVTCWGSDNTGQSSPPNDTFIQISSNSDIFLGHTCGIRADSTITCWGGIFQGQASPPGNLFGQVSSSFNHTCGVRTDNTVTCWGSDRFNESSPPDGAFKQISTGGFRSCGVLFDNSVECWGSDFSGDPDPPAGSMFKQVSAGSSHRCGVLTNGTVDCWGSDFAGQATPKLGIFDQVSTGADHTCGLRPGGTVDCWGSNDLRQATPPSNSLFDQVSEGFFIYTCGIRTDGNVECWGSDNADNVGLLSPPSGTFVQISTGFEHACGVRPDGTVDCWGTNRFGESSPPSGTFNQVSAGQFFTCGVRTDATVTCWPDFQPFIDSLLALTITSNQNNADLGQSVSDAGDINGDGFPDLIAGLPSFTAGQTREGVARLYLGTANGITSTFQQLEANQADAQFGFSVAGVGDLNNDGFDDVAIGSPMHDGTQIDQGALYIYLGSVSGLQTNPIRMIEGTNAGARLGASVSAAGDLNNDGFADLVTGVPGFTGNLQNRPTATAGANILGAIRALLGAAADAIRDNPTLITVPAPQADSGFGMSVSGGGDINGDSRDDVIVGSPESANGNNPNAGAAHIYQGTPTGLAQQPLQSLLGAVADQRFGTDVAIVDDVNRDGFADYAVSAPGRSKSQSEEGEVAVYLGNTNPSPTPVVTLQSGRQDDGFGTSITSIPDVSGDDVRELVVGAPRHTGEDPEEGAAYVFTSRPDRVYVETPRFIFEGNQPNANLGRDVSAIDFDERRSKRGNPTERNFAELALGAPRLNNSGGVFVYQLSPEELSGPGGGGSLLIDDFEQ